MNPPRVHDRALLDALEAAEIVTMAQDVWRVTLAGRNPIQGSTAPGRWSPGSGVEVLYTSVAQDGALTEIGFRLGLEPVWPSRIAHEVHCIAAVTQRTFRIADIAALVAYGIDPARYAGFDYAPCQSLAAAAHFLEFDALLVPSARHASHNLVIFMDHADATSLAVRSTTVADWAKWRGANRR